MPRTRKSQLTVTKAAALLEVSREHLSRVLNGGRTSARLTRRYQALVSAWENQPQALAK